MHGLHFGSAPRIMDLGLLYRALQEKQVDVVAGNSTDGLIATLGMVVLTDDRTATDLIQRADEKLYEAKRSGRNRVCF